MPIPSWPRPNYQPGGGEPFLLFAAFGALDLDTPIDRERYRAGRVPAGCELLLYDRRFQASSFPALEKSHAWVLAAAEAPELAGQAAKASQFAMLRGHAKPSHTLDYLRDAVGIVQYLIDRGAEVIFDPQTFQFWPAADWTERLFRPAAPVPHEHVIILESPNDDGTAWVHTRGMRKFGRPDLSIRRVNADKHDAVMELFNRLVESLASGTILTDGETITFPSLAPGGIVKLDSSLDHPEFHNAHIEIVWPAK
jgi:hypothetical protein